MARAMIVTRATYSVPVNHQLLYVLYLRTWVRLSEYYLRPLFPHRTQAGLKLHVAASAGIVKVGGGQKNLLDILGLEACE